MENNIPPGVTDPAYLPEAKMKPCHICKGTGKIEDYGEGDTCPLCEGKKEIPIDCRTIAEALEDNREDQNRHDL